MNPRRVTSRCRYAVSSAFSASDISGTAPRPSALFRHEARGPARARARRRARPGRNAIERDRVRRRRPVRSPDSAAISSFWPLPETPAMPTISPRTRRQIDADEIGAERIVRRQRQIRAPRAVRRRARAASRCCGCGRSPPIIMRASDGDALAARIASAGDLARAQHGRAVAQRADLVELVADVEDAAAFGRRAGAASRTASRPPAASAPTVGSSMISELGLLQQAAHDLDALALADRHRVDVAVADRAAGRSARRRRGSAVEQSRAGARRRRAPARCSRRP